MAFVEKVHQVIIVVMGVSGSGKTTVGRLIATTLGAAFVEGDDLHPPENVAKMAAGVPLEDADRWGWLDTIGAAVRAVLRDRAPVVVTCSALRRVYRQRLAAAAGQQPRFVFLRGDFRLLSQRMKARRGHFMPPALLRSQLETLEVPGADEDAVTIDVDVPASEVANRALAALGRRDMDVSSADSR